MPRKRRRTPQEKKRLSYERDGRNSYWFTANDKASRKAIRRNKVAASRAVRRTAKRAASGEPEDEAALDVAMKGRWRKVPDQPLGKHIAMQRFRRRISWGAKKRRRASWVPLPGGGYMGSSSWTRGYDDEP